MLGCQRFAPIIIYRTVIHARWEEAAGICRVLLVCCRVLWRLLRALTRLLMGVGRRMSCFYEFYRMQSGLVGSQPSDTVLVMSS